MKANSKRKVFGDAVDLLMGDMEEVTMPRGVQMLPVKSIQPFHDHPFHLYEGERLDDMIASVKEHGVLNPVIVQKLDAGYEMLSGHNRWNAAKLAGIKEIPAIVKYVSGETMYIWGKQYFLVFKPDNQKNSFEIQNQNIVLSMSAKSTVKQRDAYVKEEYRKILKEEIEKRLPKWEEQTGLKCDSWQTKYMVTKWGACSTDKKKLWFNLQLAQKPYACLDYIILHELTHLITRKHDATFIAHMDRYMPNWREIRKELNDSRLDYYEAQDESPLQKLIDQSRYDDIRDAAIAYIQEEYSGTVKRPSVVDMEIENVSSLDKAQLSSGIGLYGFIIHG